MSKKGNPQTEDGYTKIANELLEQLCKTDFTLTELKILLVVIRQTYGFGRKKHGISVTFLSNATGISDRRIKSAVSRLVSKNVLTEYKPKFGSRPRELGINKRYLNWLYGDASVTGRKRHYDGDSSVTMMVTNASPLMVTGASPKEKNKEKNKENIKERSPSGEADHDEQDDEDDMSWLDGLTPEERSFFV